MDLKLIYKLTHPNDSVDSYPSLIKIKNGRQLRGHRLQIEWERAHKDVRQFFFVARAGRIWNGLPERVVMSSTLGEFMSKLTKLDLKGEVHSC